MKPQQMLVAQRKEMTEIIAKDKIDKKAMRTLGKMCIAKIKSRIMHKKEVMKKGDILDILVDSKYLVTFSYMDGKYGDFLTNTLYASPKRTYNGWQLEVISTGIVHRICDPSDTFATTIYVASEDDIKDQLIMHHEDKDFVIREEV
jgi:hypothetical protein